MIKIFTLTVLTVFLLLIIELCRRGRLTFKYAAGWIFFALLGIAGAVFDRALVAVSRGCGFILPSNFIFFALLVFFIIASLFLTTFLCEQNKRNDLMAQKIAILQAELEELKSHLPQSHG